MECPTCHSTNYFLRETYVLFYLYACINCGRNFIRTRRRMYGMN